MQIHIWTTQLEEINKYLSKMLILCDLCKHFCKAFSFGGENCAIVPMQIYDQGQL